MNYANILNAIKQNPGTPNVETKLSVHQENGMILYGYGSLKHYPDLSRLIRSNQAAILPFPWRPTIHVPIEGLSSRETNFFKVLNSAEYDTGKRGSWGEYQPFPVGIDQFLSVTIFETKNPWNFQSVISIQVEVNGNNFDLIRFDAESVGNVLRGYGRSITDPAVNAVYVVSFGGGEWRY